MIIHIIVSYDQNISLIFFMWKLDPMSGFDIRLVFTLAPRDSTLLYKRCVHFLNNFPSLTSLTIPNLPFSCLSSTFTLLFPIPVLPYSFFFLPFHNISSSYPTILFSYSYTFSFFSYSYPCYFFVTPILYFHLIFLFLPFYSFLLFQTSNSLSSSYPFFLFSYSYPPGRFSFLIPMHPFIYLFPLYLSFTFLIYFSHFS